jgi:hypothetical protein
MPAMFLQHLALNSAPLGWTQNHPEGRVQLAFQDTLLFSAGPSADYVLYRCLVSVVCAATAQGSCELPPAVSQISSWTLVMVLAGGRPTGNKPMSGLWRAGQRCCVELGCMVLIVAWPGAQLVPPCLSCLENLHLHR